MDKSYKMQENATKKQKSCKGNKLNMTHIIWKMTEGIIIKIILGVLLVLFIWFIIAAIKQTNSVENWGKKNKDPLYKLRGGIR